MMSGLLKENKISANKAVHTQHAHNCNHTWRNCSSQKTFFRNPLHPQICRMSFVGNHSGTGASLLPSTARRLPRCQIRRSPPTNPWRHSHKWDSYWPKNCSQNVKNMPDGTSLTMLKSRVKICMGLGIRVVSANRHFANTWEWHFFHQCDLRT